MMSLTIGLLIAQTLSAGEKRVINIMRRLAKTIGN
jgi:hypothetical protein